jgi:putative DNA primase/helicase
MSTNYIYLLCEREFIKTNEPIYKISNSFQQNNSRILILQIICENSIDSEKELIKIFKLNFKHRKDIGNKYFEGDRSKMCKIISHYLTKNYLFDIVHNIGNSYEENKNKVNTLALGLTDIDITSFIYSLYKNKYTTVKIGKDKYIWYEFTGTRWKTITDGLSLKKKMHTTVFDMYDEARENELKRASIIDCREMDMCHNRIHTLNTIMKNLQTSSKLNTYLKELKFMCMKEVKEFYHKLDTNPYLIGFENGVFDLKNNEFRDGRPEDYLTFSTKYDYANEDNEEIQTEIYNFINSCMVDEENTKYRLRRMAYSLCGVKNLEEFYIDTGCGRNGKGAQQDLIDTTLGDYSYCPSSSLLTIKPKDMDSPNETVASIKGRRLITTTEPECGSTLQIGFIKAITGNDKIQARKLYEKNNEFVCQASIVLQCNNIPNFPENTSAFIKIQDFPYIFVDDPKFANEKLIDKTAKARFKTDVRYAQQLMRMLLKIYKEEVKDAPCLKPPASILEATKYCLDSKEHMKLFIEEYCIIEKHAEVKRTELFDAYKSSNYFKSYPLKVGTFYTEMEKLFRAKKVNGTRMLEGIKIKQYSINE